MCASHVKTPKLKVKLKTQRRIVENKRIINESVAQTVSFFVKYRTVDVKKLVLEKV